MDSILYSLSFESQLSLIIIYSPSNLSTANHIMEDDNRLLLGPYRLECVCLSARACMYQYSCQIELKSGFSSSSMSEIIKLTGRRLSTQNTERTLESVATNVRVFIRPSGEKLDIWKSSPYYIPINCFIKLNSPKNCQATDQTKRLEIVHAF